MSEKRQKMSSENEPGYFQKQDINGQNAQISTSNGSLIK